MEKIREQISMIEEKCFSCFHNGGLAKLHNLFVFNLIWGVEHAERIKYLEENPTHCKFVLSSLIH